MNHALFADEWHLVADLKFSLLSNAKLARQVNRGQVEFIILNQLDGQIFRVSEYVYPLLTRMDGRRTTNEIWHNALNLLDDMVPTQHEFMNLLSSLYKAGLVRTAEFPNIEQQRSDRQNKQRKLWLAKLKFPLAIKVPLFDPNRFLNKTRGLTAILFNPVSVIFFGLIVITAVFSFVQNWSAFGQTTADSLISLENVILMAFIYPVVKAIHEFGHAYCVKHWGGEVHEMGIMFLVFFPVPYVDASASACFPNKYARMLVGAAGVIVELILTAIAIHVWVAAEPSVVQALAYNVIIICGVSTLLFNGNPLLRFDAYYVLSDWWEEPNLGKVANAQLGYLLKRYMLRIPTSSGVWRTNWQNLRLVIYAVSSYVYRMLVMVLIAVYVASGFFVLGVLIGLMSIYFGFLQPTWKFLMTPFNDEELRQYPLRTRLLFGSALALIISLLFFIPLPHTLTIEGVVIPQDTAYVRAPANGIIEDIQQNAQNTEVGVLLVKLLPEQLIDTQVRLEQRLSMAKQNVALHLMDPIERKKSEQTASWMQDRINVIQQQIDDSSIKAAYTGHWIPESGLQQGQFVGQGTRLGYLLDRQLMQVTSLVPEADVNLIKSQNVTIKRVSNGELYTGEIITQGLNGSRIIQYPRLTVEGGGAIATQKDEQQRLVAVKPYVNYEIALPYEHAQLHERVYVQYKLSNEPIFFRIYRSVRRTFLNWFGY